MLESTNEIYLCDYNSPSIQMKKSGKKKSKKILFTPIDYPLAPKKSRTDKHLKTLKINPDEKLMKLFRKSNLNEIKIIEKYESNF